MPELPSGFTWARQRRWRRGSRHPTHRINRGWVGALYGIGLSATPMGSHRPLGPGCVWPHGTHIAAS